MYALILSCDNRQEITLPLKEEQKAMDPLARLLRAEESKACVYSDLGYRIKLKRSRFTPIADVDFFLNDSQVDVKLIDNELAFRYTRQPVALFRESYGLITLALCIHFENGDSLNLKSQDLPVMVRKGPLNEAVRQMADYVHAHQEGLSIEGEAALEDQDMLQVYLDRTERICRIYQESLPYFKANPRHSLELRKEVGKIEQLTRVDQESLRHMLLHPAFLKPSMGGPGLRFGRRTYLPDRALISSYHRHHDSAENRAVLGFLGTLTDRLNQALRRIEELLSAGPKAASHHEAYVYSPALIFSKSKEVLEHSKEALIRLQGQLTGLILAYQDALGIRPAPLEGLPPPNQAFLGVLQYRRIYQEMQAFFLLPPYRLQKERFMLSFIKISDLYETYALSKLMTYIREMGYRLSQVELASYPMPERFTQEEQLCNNIYHFELGEAQITLYYKPTIYADPEEGRQMGLYRNSSVSFDQHLLSYASIFYTPDFVIVFHKEGGDAFLILDAKFTDLDHVRTGYMREVAFKYLFSLSPLKKEDKLLGLCLLYGKASEAEVMHSFYDRAQGEIYPLAQLFPLCEERGEAAQFEDFDQLFDLIDSGFRL